MNRLYVVLCASASTIVIGMVAAVSSQAPPASSAKPTGTLAQIMRGIYFPDSNLIFDVQQNDPAQPKKRPDTTHSTTDKFINLYPGWQVVENAAIVLTDSVDLLLTPGRLCENGKPVPIDRTDYKKFSAQMRAAGLTVLQAARSKNQEKVSDATGDLTDACTACHQVYRRGPAEGTARCTAPK
ncbi:MAG TPA: cytochrome c [Vicinamibacterales bacterium]